MMEPNFFDQFPEFYETSTAGNIPRRLNWRNKILIEENIDLIKDKNILDITSHDGRFSFSAIMNGANHVTGIEGRQKFVDNSNLVMEKYHIPRNKYDFICGDIFKEIPKIKKSSVDTVFCFGILYHTTQPYQLLSEIARIAPKSIIIDTNVLKAKQPVIRLSFEDSAKDGGAIGKGQVIIGVPSMSALYLMLNQLGYSCKEVDWRKFGIKNWETIEHYNTHHMKLLNKIRWAIWKIRNPTIIGGKRVTIVCEKKEYSWNAGNENLTLEKKN